MEKTRDFIEQLGFPRGDCNDLPTSSKRFPDGAQYRVEIPSVEGPKALQAVIEMSEKYEIDIHRVSQGSGIMLQTDEEIKEMVELGEKEKMEVSLFVGPRGSFDISAMQKASSGGVAGIRSQGVDQLVYALEDVKRACDLGIRSILVGDEGVLWLCNEAKKAGELPKELIIKVSVQISHPNPVSVKLMEDIGADTYNVPTDLTLARLATIRQAIDIPIDIYIEAPDDIGGFIRHYDIPEIIRVASPVYIKFGLRNAPNIYPSGTHLEDLAVKLTKERMRRAKIGLSHLKRYGGENFITSEKGAKGLGLPVTVKQTHN